MLSPLQPTHTRSQLCAHSSALTAFRHPVCARPVRCRSLRRMVCTKLPEGSCVRSCCVRPQRPSPFSLLPAVGLRRPAPSLSPPSLACYIVYKETEPASAWFASARLSRSGLSPSKPAKPKPAEAHYFVLCKTTQLAAKLMVQILRLVPAHSPVRQPESTQSTKSSQPDQCREST
jgi:hypothetical protein